MAEITVSSFTLKQLVAPLGELKQALTYDDLADGGVLAKLTLIFVAVSVFSGQVILITPKSAITEQSQLEDTLSEKCFAL